MKRKKLLLGGLLTCVFCLPVAAQNHPTVPITVGDITAMIDDYQSPDNKGSITVDDISALIDEYLQQGVRKDWQLIVWQTSGAKLCYDLDEQPKTTFDASSLVLSTSKTSLTFPLSDIVKYTYAEKGMAELTPTSAQTVPNYQDAVFVYRNDGTFDAFLLENVDSMKYSQLSETQKVYTPDSVYSIPLAAIDSIGFHADAPEYQRDVMLMNTTWIPYVIRVTESTVTFRRDTPANFLPVKGQVVAAETFDVPFESGFAGRVSTVTDYTDSIVYTVEGVGLSDIYRHLVCTGRSTSYLEGEDTLNAKRRVFDINSTQFPLPSNISIPIGPVTVSCAPSVYMDWAICIFEENLRNQAKLVVHHTYNGSVQLDCKFDAEYNPEPKWLKTFIPITTSVPGLYGKIMFGGFLSASGSVEVSATQPFTITGSSGFSYTESKGIQRINDWNAQMEDTEISISLDGSVSAGLAVRLQFGVFHEKVASADITAYLGPKLSGNLKLSTAGVIDKTLYSAIKDSEITLSLNAKVVPGYRYWGNGDHQEFPVSPELDYDLNHWYVVPEFSNLKYTPDETGFSGQLSGTISRNLLSKVSIGWGLYDENDNLYRAEYYLQTYRKIEDWPWNGMEKQFTDLPYGSRYKAYPLVKLMGVEMRATESADVSIDPKVVSYEEPEVKGNKATVAGHVEGLDYGMVTDAGICYSLTPSSNNWNRVSAGNKVDGDFSVELTNLEEDKTYYYCTYAYIDGEYYYGEVYTFKTTHTHTSCPDSNHPHAIDLGLPSGTKWACCNIGASSPEGYGGYYAWGETEEKSVYNADTYKYYNENTGFVNIGSDIAGTSYDVAHVKWGGSWRMPTTGQQQELLNKCSSEWTSENGVSGRRFTGPNGASVFLPAAGFRWYGDLYYVGRNGPYWSSSLYPSSDDCAYDLYFDSGLPGWSYGNRPIGHSVRAVCP